MSLSVVTRASNGAPLTATQNDTNLTNIQTEVNATESTIATLTSGIALCITQASFNSYFSGLNGGKQQVDWANVINQPSSYPFRATMTGIDQVCSVTGGTPFSATISLNTVDFAVPGSAINVSANTWTAPATGNYLLNGSGQIQLTSGSPTSIAMLVNILKNGSGLSSATIDLGSNTGTRIFRITDFVALTQGDVITLNIQINQTGNSTWTVSANENTDLSGFMVQLNG